MWTRRRDRSGQYLSLVAFADMDKSFRQILRVSKRAVMNLGPLGAFDEHGIFPFAVLRDGSRILAYTCGWSRRVSVPVETSIGLAESQDHGLTFNRIGVGGDNLIVNKRIEDPFLIFPNAANPAFPLRNCASMRA